MATVALGEPLSVEALRHAAAGGELALELGADARARVEAAHRTVAAIAAGGRPVYGVNTGFGALAHQRIGADDLGRLQHNLLVSHAVGTGPALSAAETRLALFLRIHSLCRGVSGVRLELVEWLVRLFESGWVPRVPEQGSVGACGDLAPLSHLALPVLGEGQLLDPGGALHPAGPALQKLGLQPMQLEAKEGLALINGVQVSNAIGLAAWARMCVLSATAEIAGALSVEALMASHRPYDERVTNVRPHPGAQAAAANMRSLLSGSEVAAAHADCDRVQDPYSFRCIPQVHGAAKDALEYLGRALHCEADSATDNPLVFPAEGETISAGNFHGHPIAMPLDHGVHALCAWGNISERRTAILIDRGMSGLPAFLTPQPGLNSGLMIPQVVAAALASENKVLAHPASVDTIPTSADQEDHVSMSAHAARKLRDAVGNAERVLAIELYTAAQAREFQESHPMGRGAEAAYRCLRKRIPPLREDRLLGPELDLVHEMLRGGEVLAAAESAAGPLAV